MLGIVSIAKESLKRGGDRRAKKAEGLRVGGHNDERGAHRGNLRYVIKSDRVRVCLLPASNELLLLPVACQQFKMR